MACSQKNIGLRKIENILVSYYNKNIFSACSLAFFHGENKSLKHCSIYCGTTDEYNGVKIDNSSLFDLASLTKPLVTLLSILTLIERKELAWSDTLKDLLPRHKSHNYNDVTVFHLLCHSSGLPAHRAYWHALETMDAEKRRRWLINEIVDEKMQYEAGEEHLYSDLGYLLLGFIVEEKTGKELAFYWNEVIAKPMGLDNTLFFPGMGQPEKSCFVATCPQNKDRPPGIVDDDNCRALGGASGHAGLFGTASGVLKLCQELVDIVHGKKSRLHISSQTLRRACSRVGASEWTAGFNMPSRTGSSSGKYFSDKSIGHLGFTGTSFWIDPVKKLAVVLLTNRIIKGNNMEGIKEFRPQIHNHIIENLR